MPEVSICIPTYNTARYLPQAIDSVLRQDFDDYELVICDDVSTDETPEICAGYDDPRIRYIRYEESGKQAGNFNRCLIEARGEFVTLLHADDYFLPGFIADRVKRLKENPEAGFVFGSVQVVDTNSKITSISGHWNEDHYFQSGELLDTLLFGCVVCPPSFMARKSCIDLIGPFRRDLTWGHDWEWSLRLAEKFGACYASKPLSAYRVHDASGTSEQLNAAKNGYQERMILRETLDRISAANPRFAEFRRPAFQALSRRHMYFAEQALLAERRKVVRNNLWYAARADISMLIRPTFYALLAGSIAPVSWYSRYRDLRGALVSVN